MFEKIYSAKFNNEGYTVFESDTGRVMLTRLFGMYCESYRTYRRPHCSNGMLKIRTDKGVFEGNDFSLNKYEAVDNGLVIAMESPGMRVLISYYLCDKTGVLKRTEHLENIGDTALCLYEYSQRIPFAFGDYEVYAQQCYWATENQGYWQDLRYGTLELACEGGRTAKGGTPFAVLRNKDTAQSVAFHLIPYGDWSMRFNCVTNGSADPNIVFESGQGRRDMKICLNPGEFYESPMLLMHHVHDIDIHLSAWKIQQYALHNMFKATKTVLPVVYNTWFYCYTDIHVNRLEEQLAAAKEIGCEVFVVDAGWFGTDKDGWWEDVGDWNEKTDSAFFGNMSQFADKVRAEGLGFGLWMEPERVHPRSKIYHEHPDWFIYSKDGFYYPDFTQVQVYEYFKNLISSKIEIYDLKWIKVDYNFDFGHDEKGNCFGLYYKKWYGMIDELRERHPSCFFEACAGGGGRFELSTLSHFDGHFPSDNVNPLDVLRISEGLMLRVPAGRTTKWVVIKKPGSALSNSEKNVVACPLCSDWSDVSLLDIEFVVMTAMTGVLGFSGDIASLTESNRQIILKLVNFYKQWREFIYSSRVTPLTAPKHITNKKGWTALLISPPEADKFLVFIFKLTDANPAASFRLPGLDRDGMYNVSQYGKEDYNISGAELTDHGLEVIMGMGYQMKSALFVITKIS